MLASQLNDEGAYPQYWENTLTGFLLSVHRSSLPFPEPESYEVWIYHYLFYCFCMFIVLPVMKCTYSVYLALQSLFCFVLLFPWPDCKFWAHCLLSRPQSLYHSVFFVLSLLLFLWLSDTLVFPPFFFWLTLSPPLFLSHSSTIYLPFLSVSPFPLGIPDPVGL